MINGEITGAEELRVKFGALPGAILSKLVIVMNAAMIDLQAKVKNDKLSGQVLSRRTGRLSRSINEKVTQDGTLIKGSVGTNVVYAAAHEYGFQGAVTVREHVQMRTQAFGKPIKNGPIAVTIRAHAMKMNLPERSFLRSSLAESASSIRAQLNNAVAEAVSA
jgi:phage gpG-like protein